MFIFIIKTFFEITIVLNIFIYRPTPSGWFAAHLIGVRRIKVVARLGRSAAIGVVLVGHNSRHAVTVTVRARAAWGRRSSSGRGRSNSLLEFGLALRGSGGWRSSGP
jgi:hypothetical protein